MKKPAFVYLLHHKGLDSLKVGIGNRDSKPNRINVHKRHGWELIFIQQFEVGWDALNVETAFFTWLRKEKGIPPHLSIQEMPQSGWAETFSLDRISTVDAKRKLTSVIRSI